MQALEVSRAAKLVIGVMNTETEIHQAFEDCRRGRMGAINS